MRLLARPLAVCCRLGSRTTTTASTASSVRLVTTTPAMSGSAKLKPAARVAGSRQDVWWVVFFWFLACAKAMLGLELEGKKTEDDALPRQMAGSMIISG